MTRVASLSVLQVEKISNRKGWARRNVKALSHRKHRKALSQPQFAKETETQGGGENSEGSSFVRPGTSKT
jgi:hypothetical protein